MEDKINWTELVERDIKFGDLTFEELKQLESSPHRWRAEITKMVIAVDAQLAQHDGTLPDAVKWRKSALRFKSSCVQRIQDVNALLKESPQPKHTDLEAIRSELKTVLDEVRAIREILIHEFAHPEDSTDTG